jgi:LysR family glycine cleavage system transcriptional activator
MTRRLPPLNALRAFEATARNGSLTRAAQELSVTQGAVSRHVLQLEAWLGVALCSRQRRGIETTAEGAALAAVLGDVFDRIEAQTRRMRQKPMGNTLRIKLPPTFAIRWLVPRLARFHALNRHIDVQITTSHQTVDFELEDIDVCIHAGGPPSAGLVSRRLFGEVLLPVCSPGIFQKYPPIETPGDLAGHVLLCSLHRPDDWPVWLKAAGTRDIDGNEGLKFENSALAYQATIDELGVVMAQWAFVEDDIRSGRLVAPLSLRVATSSAYHLAYPRSTRKLPLIEAFSNWILEQAAPVDGAGL